MVCCAMWHLVLVILIKNANSELDWKTLCGWLPEKYGGYLQYCTKI